MLQSILTFCLLFTSATAQTSAPTPTSQDPQKVEFDLAFQAFESRQYDVALTDFKQLIAQYPANDTYKKFGSEAALDTGDAKLPLQILPAIEAAHPDDWQTRLLLARAYQATVSEPAHQQKRDEEIDTVTRMHNSGDHPTLAKLRDFLLETVHQGDKTIQFYPAFVPWGPYKVSLIARIFDASNKAGLRVTLESDDVDQPNFALQHPESAAAGDRAYSLDGYGPEQKSPTGQTIQTHYTYAFFTGKPSYDVVRERILAVAAEKASPLSGRTGPVN